MTIITKPSNEKKSDKLALPLFTDGHGPSAPPASINGDAENHGHSSLHVISQRRRTSSATTIFLFLSAIAVMCMGILGGVAIYRLYVPSQMDRMRFHGFCGVPYDSQSISDEDMLKVNNIYRSSNFDPISEGKFLRYNMPEDTNGKGDFFSEEFELDLSDEESFAKISVPEFKDGRSGRFIHDFKQNESVIIDIDASRCFIMPLDRDTVLPPKNLYDLLVKMWNGYYNIDTERIRKNMRVVTPELTDLSLVSPKITAECKGMKIYLLEKYINGVFKRDVHITDAGKFAAFSGKHIVEIDLVNINEIDNLEKESKK